MVKEKEKEKLSLPTFKDFGDWVKYFEASTKYYKKVGDEEKYQEHLKKYKRAIKIEEEKKELKKPKTKDYENWTQYLKASTEHYKKIGDEEMYQEYFERLRETLKNPEIYQISNHELAQIYEEVTGSEKGSISVDLSGDYDVIQKWHVEENGKTKDEMVFGDVKRLLNGEFFKINYRDPDFKPDWSEDGSKEELKEMYEREAERSQEWGDDYEERAERHEMEERIKELFPDQDENNHEEIAKIYREENIAAMYRRERREEMNLDR